MARGVGRLLLWPVCLASLVLCVGCGGGSPRLERVWGQRGLRPGELIRPRCAVIDTRGDTDVLYIVDFTGRVQAYTRDGEYLRGWSTPDITNGRPAGLGLGADGSVLVADSHYGRVLVYSPAGELLRTLDGKAGEGPGPFAYVSDVVQDAAGHYYIVEFGAADRIRKYAPDGRYLRHWGTHGSEPGQFARPRGAAIGPDGLLYVADSGNHRVQVFDLEGRLVRIVGKQGSRPGELNYPYDLAFGPDGDLYVVEWGNHRVQRFTRAGKPKGTWGTPGREPGSLHSPWGLAVDRRGRVHVLDTENHRVQRIDF
jgi:sugar lactone lactonase YvrE